MYLTKFQIFQRTISDFNGTAMILVIETSTISELPKSKAMMLTSDGVGFTRLFGSKVVEDLNNR